MIRSNCTNPNLATTHTPPPDHGSLDEARTRLDRLDAREAYDAVRAGAVLVDIRPQINRDMEGGLPGAVVIDRNVLDWRLDPASDARLPVERSKWDRIAIYLL